MSDNAVWLLIIALLAFGYFFYRHQEYQKQKVIVTQRRDALIGEPIPHFIQQSMADYKSGAFSGEDKSPLAYVGYRAGKTANMPASERRQRLEVCFKVNFPSTLPAKYRNWGAPATTLRYHKIQQHLHRLAGQRRGRHGYETAVRHWTEDRGWFVEEFTDTARRFARSGYKY